MAMLRVLLGHSGHCPLHLHARTGGLWIAANLYYGLCLGSFSSGLEAQRLLWHAAFHPNQGCSGTFPKVLASSN